MQIKDNENKLGIFFMFLVRSELSLFEAQAGKHSRILRYWTVHVKDKLIPFNFTFLNYFGDFFQLCWLEVSKSFKTYESQLMINRIYARGENKPPLLLIQFPLVPSNNFEPILLYHLLFVPKIRTTRDPGSAVVG